MRFSAYLLCAGLSLLLAVASAQPSGYSSSLFNNSTFPRAINTSKPVGATAGSAATSPGGAVTYAIPIATAPGTNGMVPSVSLVYHSQSGNGLLGQGWSISGLSVITRAGKDMYHDGKVSPLTYTDEDAFLLDGARLSVLTRTNGADGATYGTEVESYAAITSLGRVADCPEKFKVTTKDGIVMEYGYTADARLQTSADGRIMMWRLSKMQDINGNYIEFVYDNANRDSRISQIRYTGNSVTGLAPYNTIDFEYIERYYDKNTVYDAGNTINQYYLLHKIKIKAESSLYKTYTCNYAMSNIGASFLKYIEESSATGTALHDTRFLYGEESSALSVAASNIVTPVPNTSDPSSGITEVYLSSGDYDGDGINEIVTSKLSYAPTGMSGGGIKNSWSAKAYKVSGYGSTTYADFDIYSAEGVKGIAGLRMSENSLSLSSTQRRQGAYSSLGFADFNGDGKEDVLSYNVLAIYASGGTTYELDKMSIFYPGSTAGTFTEVNVAPMVRPALYSDNRFVRTTLLHSAILMGITLLISSPSYRISTTGGWVLFLSHAKTN
ncbi:MAG: hypothetical protein JNL13_10745 [Chitinophagaceae bacterium]|nr:hypothetical protein [Chitinophagaceae bacterium]